ncbi:hypothetical protein Xbud_00105 [Xenorhabdus budapestensis]|uniref:Uncharacterized protein n=1 Tax=Xenorhabdus budapestensis TaxID=290110 RepID=A0A2D0J4Z5_XENBU|nr:hypothetical protein Xbud_00105 [Xenorhabdus budapestensis]
MLAHRAVQCVTGLSNLQEINDVNNKENFPIGFLDNYAE